MFSYEKVDKNNIERYMELIPVYAAAAIEKGQVQTLGIAKKGEGAAAILLFSYEEFSEGTYVRLLWLKVAEKAKNKGIGTYLTDTINRVKEETEAKEIRVLANRELAGFLLEKYPSVYRGSSQVFTMDAQELLEKEIFKKYLQYMDKIKVYSWEELTEGDRRELFNLLRREREDKDYNINDELSYVCKNSEGKLTSVFLVHMESDGSIQPVYMVSSRDNPEELLTILAISCRRAQKKAGIYRMLRVINPGEAQLKLMDLLMPEAVREKRYVISLI